MGKKRVIQKSAEAVQTKEQPTTGGKRKLPKIEKGRIYIRASYNNTAVTLTDEEGNVLGAASAGMLGFKGPKKATPYAATRIVAALGDKIKKIGLKSVDVYVKGIGSGRESAIRSLPGQGIQINSIKDITPIPHNGPRPPKPRRV